MRNNIHSGGGAARAALNPKTFRELSEYLVYKRATPVAALKRLWGLPDSINGLPDPPSQKLPSMIIYDNLCRFYSLFNYAKKLFPAIARTFQHLSHTFQLRHRQQGSRGGVGNSRTPWRPSSTLPRIRTPLLRYDKALVLLLRPAAAMTTSGELCSRLAGLVWHSVAGTLQQFRAQLQLCLGF
jgi:hypothetical protein